MKLVFWVGALLLCGCVQASVEPVVAPSPEPTPVPSPTPTRDNRDMVALSRASVAYRTVFLQTSFFRDDAAQNYVFRSDADVATFASSHSASEVATRQLSLDFNNEVGLLRMFGFQPTLERGEFFAVTDDGHVLKAHSVRWVGDFPADGLAAISHPAHYIAIAKTDKEILFADTLDVPYSKQSTEIAWPKMTSQ